MITKLDIECEGEDMLKSYGDPKSQNFDGIHMRGSQAIPHMTRSFVKMLTKTFPHLNPTNKLNQKN